MEELCPADTALPIISSKKSPALLQKCEKYIIINVIKHTKVYVEFSDVYL